ncbi:hypothetical protein [Leifsonia poae]|uniref:hypothetical protein n=1 Tax=Leifsonia poae TaxID=110933 RepID=UPI001CBEF5AF|nr:hypothetical protein [Leifsonia poae]
MAESETTQRPADPGVDAAEPAAAAPGGAPRRRPRIRWYWWVVAAVSVVVMAGGVATVASVVSMNENAPRVAVARYLEALVHGTVSRALALTGTTTSESDVLLTDKAYAKAARHISGFTLAAPTVKGGTATVRATIKQAAHTYTQTFALTRTGQDFVVFDHWKLRPVALTRVAIAFDGPEQLPFTIAGQPLQSGPDVELRAFPGTYDVHPAFTDTMLGAPTFSVTAIGFGGAKPQPAAVSIGLTNDGEKAANQAVNDYLDTCAASTDMVPDGCPFHAVSGDGITIDSVEWSIVTRPEFTIGEWAQAGYAVVSTKLGAAQMTGTAHDGKGNSGEVGTPDIPFPVIGTVRFDGATAIYSQLVK